MWFVQTWNLIPGDNLTKKMCPVFLSSTESLTEWSHTHIQIVPYLWICLWMEKEERLVQILRRFFLGLKTECASFCYQVIGVGADAFVTYVCVCDWMWMCMIIVKLESYRVLFSCRYLVLNTHHSIFVIHCAAFIITRRNNQVFMFVITPDFKQNILLYFLSVVFICS